MDSQTRIPALCLALSLAMAIIPALAAAADEPTWREVDENNLVFMEMQEGQVVIELNPLFAPKTVRQFRRLVQEGFYDGLSFYRVIEGFVAQGGDGSDLGERSEVPLIDAEFEIEWRPGFEFTPVQQKDFYADETVFIDGFAVGRDHQNNTAWLAHCPGVVAMARNEGPDTSRTDFYIVIGQAPRYLDRNLNVFGRVVSGMDVVQKIRRGKASDDGVIFDDAASSRIRRMTMAADIPEDDRLKAYVMDTSNKAFRKYLEDRRNRKARFFHHKPPKVLDICQVPVGGRVTR